MEPITIEEVIEGFNQASFSDLGSAVPYLRKLFATHLPDQDTPPVEIKRIIVTELAALKEAIEKHFAGAFMIQAGRDGSDHKHGHWMVMHWILSRWFQNANGPEDVPAWYMATTRIVPGGRDREHKMCSAVIDQLLEMLQDEIV